MNDADSINVGSLFMSRLDRGFLEREVRRLSIENAAMRGALRPFAELAQVLDSKMGHLPKTGALHSWHITPNKPPLELTVEMLIAARQALPTTEAENG